MDDYASYDGVGLAELVANGQVTPAELVEAARVRTQRHNPRINAVVHEAFDEALATEPAVGPLRGAPFLVKDLLIQVAGWPRRSGSRFFQDVVDTEDDGLTRRYRQSGVSLVGKSNCSEFGIAGTTEGQLYGPCRNPWNLNHSVGGSSGGAAAAVAAGIVPMAHGGDGRGSIRIPASCCGLVGLKPTRDRVPHLPDGYDAAQGFVVEHVLTRTVRDCAAMLDATGVPEPRSPYAAPPKARPYAEEVLAAPGRLRIAWSTLTANGRPCHPEIQAAAEATADLLSKLGHEVVPHELPVEQRALWGAQNAYSGANFAAGLRRMIAATNREPQGDDFEGLTWASWKGGQRAGGMDALADMQDLRVLARQALQLWETFDIFLTPTMAAPPPPIGYLSPVLNAPRDIGRRNGEFFSYPGVANMTGQPSISLPLAWSSEGLPMGMMFTGRYADEATLFRLAAQLEKEAPWKDRKPAVWG
ncbi:MAG TPA: amidase family protein [Caulobacteraceae bacterium]|jgi:amidase